MCLSRCVTHGPRAELEQVFDDATEQASSVIRLGPFAEFVDHQQRA